MKNSFKIIGVILCAIVLAGCTKSFNSGTKKTGDRPAVKSAVSEDDWQSYKNTEFGISFKYPKDWILEPSTNSFLDAHLYSAALTEPNSTECQKDFIGMEIQAGLPKDADEDFKSFAQSLLDGGLGRPSGKMMELQIDGKTILQSEFSGWDSPCQGHGYLIEQDKAHYIYIFTGSDKMNEKKTQPRVILDIIQTIQGPKGTKKSEE